MALSMVEYVGTEGQQTFAVPFPHLRITDLKVLINKEQRPFTYSNGAIHLEAPLAEESLVRIQRETSLKTRIVDFTDLAMLSEKDLDADSLQAFYALQELFEAKAESLEVVDGAYWDMKGLCVRYVADPEDDSDAVNFRTMRVALEVMDDKVEFALEQVYSILEDVRLIALECRTYLDSAREYSDHAEGSMIQAEAAAKEAEDSRQHSHVSAVLSEKSRAESMTHANRSEVAAENSQQSAAEAEDTRLDTDALRLKAEKAAVDSELSKAQAGTEALNSNAYAVNSQLAANDAALSRQLALEGASTASIEATKAQGFAAEAGEALDTVKDYSTQAHGSAESALIAQGASEAAQAAVAASKEAVDLSTIQAKQAADKAVQEASEADASAIAAKTSQAQSEEILRRVTELVGSITHNGLMDAGAFDASTGVLPAKPELSSYWLVTASGICGELELATGDTLVYSATMDTFYKIDSTDNVVSVNGQKGAVVLTAEDVGALTTETGAEHFQAKGEYAAAQHSHERDQIIGMEGQTPDATIELAEDNLNDITGAGFYRQGLNGMATAERNYPVAEAGLLFVSPGSYGMQEYTGYQTNTKYLRSLDAHGVWSAWVLPKGEKGEKGDKGDQGVQGVNGVMGPAGAIGPKGDVGAEGPQGVQGPIGPKGDKGDPGATDPLEIGALPLTGGTVTGDVKFNGVVDLAKGSGDAIICSALTSSRKQLLAGSGGDVYVGNPTARLYLETASSVKLQHGTHGEGKVYTSFDKPTPAEIGAKTDATKSFYLKGSSAGYVLVKFPVDDFRKERIRVWRSFSEEIGGADPNWNGGSPTHFGACSINLEANGQAWGGSQCSLDINWSYAYTRLLGNAWVGGGGDYCVFLALRASPHGQGAKYYFDYPDRSAVPDVTIAHFDATETAPYNRAVGRHIGYGEFHIRGMEVARRWGQSNWVTEDNAIHEVAGLLGWKAYGNNHVIFDASAGTTPSGTPCNNTNSTHHWSATHPTLMGWNGVATYGVRVDSARHSDSTNQATVATQLNGTVATSGQDLTIHGKRAVVGDGAGNQLILNYNQDFGAGTSINGRVYAAEYRGNANVSGTGEAIHTPAGIYSTGNNWLYGPVMTNGNIIDTRGGQITCGDVISHGTALSTRWKRGYQNQNGAGSHTHVGLPQEAIAWLNQGNDVEFRILHKNGGYMGDHTMVVPYTAWNGGATEYVQHVANVGHCWLFIGGSSKGQCKAEYQGVTHIYYRLAV